MEFLPEILHLLLQAKVLVGAHALFLVSPPKTESVTKHGSEGRSAGDWSSRWFSGYWAAVCVQGELRVCFLEYLAQISFLKDC